jgi:tellurite methyltransferase
MTQQERERWNRRYREGSHASGAPDPFLVESYEEYIQPLFPRGGAALDLAGGVGRNAVWLAQRGWRVTLADISEIAIAKARRNAEEHGVELEYWPGDACQLNLGRARFDLIMVFFFLERDLFPRLRAALRPGGLLIYKTYTEEQPKFGRGPTHPMHFLKAGELLRAFSRMRVLYCRETLRERAVAELVALKPPAAASAGARR